MKCIRCHRPLLTYAWSAQSRTGIIGMGPKCAKLAGLAMPKPGIVKAPERATEANPAQLELWL